MVGSRAFLFALVLGSACGGVPHEADPPDDPEQRAIERVLSEPAPAPRAAAVDRAAPFSRPAFPWLADSVPPTDVTDPEAEVGDPDAWGDSSTARHRLGRHHLSLALHGEGHDAGEHLRRALAAFDRVVEDDAAGSRNEALFDRFAAELLRGDATQWRAAALELVRDAPTSPNIPYVYLAFAETSLDAGRPDDAIAFAQKALTFTSPHARAFAFHDAAWAYLQSDPPDHKEAMFAFVKVIDETQRDDFPFPATGRALRTAARHDIVAPFAVAGRPDAAEAFFTRIGRGPADEDMVDEMLAALAAAKRLD